MLAAGSAASGAAAAAAGGKGGASSDLAAASVWDRREFLQRCADHVGLVATALDESVADAMATGTNHSGTIAGKLNGLMTPTTPLGWRIVYTSTLVEAFSE
jgi:hypothetical protein